MKRALERQAQGEASVIPIILRPTHWQITPFGKLRVLPANAKPVKSLYWNDRDEAFLNIVEHLSLMIDEYLFKLNSDSSTVNDSEGNEQNIFPQDNSISTGFQDLDRLIRGFYDSDLITRLTTAREGRRLAGDASLGQ